MTRNTLVKVKQEHGIFCWAVGSDGATGLNKSAVPATHTRSVLCAAGYGVRSCAQGGHAGHSSFIVCLLCAVVNGYGTGEETELSAGISFWAVGLYGPEGPLSSSPPCALLLIRTQDSGSTLGSMALSSAEWEDVRGQELAGHPGMGALHPHPQSAVPPPPPAKSDGSGAVTEPAKGGGAAMGSCAGRRSGKLWRLKGRSLRAPGAPARAPRGTSDPGRTPWLARPAPAPSARAPRPSLAARPARVPAPRAPSRSRRVRAGGSGQRGRPERLQLEPAVRAPCRGVAGIGPAGGGGCRLVCDPAVRGLGCLPVPVPPRGHMARLCALLPCLLPWYCTLCAAAGSQTPGACGPVARGRGVSGGANSQSGPRLQEPAWQGSERGGRRRAWCRLELLGFGCF